MKKLFKIATLLTFVFLLFSCGGSGKKAERKGSEVFTDAKQRQVAIPRPVKRIISMAPNVTELLFAIGLDEEIAGVTDFCDYPEAAKSKPKIGGYFNPNIEAILLLEPDLIVATPDGYSKGRVEKLDSTGVAVFIVNSQSVDEMLETILILGKVAGKSDTAEPLVDKLQKRVRAVRDSVESIPKEKRPKVFYEIGHDPIITAGPGTFIDHLITTAGGVNIAGDAATGWPRYNVEAIITKEPDIIITAPHVSSGDKDQIESRTNAWKKYRTIPAVKNNRIYPVDSNLLMRSGPRLVEGLEILHDLFVKNETQSKE